MHLTINGEPQGVGDGLTVADLINHLGLNQQRIAIEVNREVIARERYTALTLTEGDQIEIVHFVGGG